MAVIKQAISTAIVSYLCALLGVMYTWPSSTLVLFSSANTTLDRPMTETEVALLGSLSSISALISTPFSGYLLDTLGRKYSCMLFALSQVLAWVVVSISYNVVAILTAIFISGFSGCMMLVVPIYVSEICQESIRGTMTSGVMVFYGFGMLASYLMGGYLSYEAMIYSCLSMSVLGVLLLVLLKESPLHLMRKGLEKDAAKVIAYYRSVKVTSKTVEEEIQMLRRAMNPDFDDLTPEVEKLKPEFKENQKMSAWKFFKKSRSSRRALVVALVLYTAAIFQGLMVVQVYAEPLFAEAVPTMSPTICSVISAILTVVSGFIAAFLMEWAGRRNLMIYASLGACVSCIVLGTQIHLHWGPHWITALFMYLFVIMYTCGAGTVPFVLVAEIFLPEIRSVASMIAVEWCLICSFVVLFVFNPLVTAVGLGPVFYFFASVCLLSSIFSFFFVPETKGLTVDVIQNLFASPRKC
ncbi:PREDICTED: facilitated trehalose transporter Tret1-like isoform X1 [Papilio xuthus]|uniref:Facilitated trehalose transporter Tret1-like isoform X1 n=2 Tax=Papilio xuthus TaxID=66420 RepID=A0AAJ6ZXD1_PAPXU|nr:PREDICTED: facilitated trehalose transporter Tret1-like isoform X1 [Papilio xuthus]